MLWRWCLERDAIAHVSGKAGAAPETGWDDLREQEVVGCEEYHYRGREKITHRA